FFVLETNLVKRLGIPAQRAPGYDSALRLVVRQRIRWHLFSVVDASDDDRIVHVAIHKVDDHFLANSRDVNHAPLLTRPRSGHPQPAGAVAIVLSFTVPGELHFDAAVFIGEDLFSLGSHYRGRLRPVRVRNRSDARRPEYGRT